MYCWIDWSECCRQHWLLPQWPGVRISLRNAPFPGGVRCSRISCNSWRRHLDWWVNFWSRPENLIRGKMSWYGGFDFGVRYCGFHVRLLVVFLTMEYFLFTAWRLAPENMFKNHEVDTGPYLEHTHGSAKASLSVLSRVVGVWHLTVHFLPVPILSHCLGLLYCFVFQVSAQALDTQLRLNRTLWLQK